MSQTTIKLPYTKTIWATGSINDDGTVHPGMFPVVPNKKRAVKPRPFYAFQEGEFTIERLDRYVIFNTREYRSGHLSGKEFCADVDDNLFLKTLSLPVDTREFEDWTLMSKLFEVDSLEGNGLIDSFYGSVSQLGSNAVIVDEPDCTHRILEIQEMIDNRVVCENAVYVRQTPLMFMSIDGDGDHIFSVSQLCGKIINCVSLRREFEIYSLCQKTDVINVLSGNEQILNKEDNTDWTEVIKKLAREHFKHRILLWSDFYPVLEKAITEPEVKTYFRGMR